ncbi:MAG: M20 family peptidase [Acidobacteria bacterium]|nr:MAG: M20 family peptidase [Acidobacteriota bacterium]
MKRLATIFGLLVLLAAVLFTRAVTVRSSQLEVTPVTGVRVDAVSAVQRLALAVTFETVSRDGGEPAAAAFRDLHAFLEGAFPRVHQSLEREVVNELSLLYAWRGKDPSLEPVLLASHLDVVPVAPESLASWTHPPFAGVVAGGYVWGRGTMDDKVGVLGLLEGVESLLRDGFWPERTIYLAFGHDEELGGRQGAARIAALLASRGVRLSLVLDEGMVVADGLVPGLERRVAMIGVAEKGYVNLELEARAAGGHSSVPPRETAVDVLAAALLRLRAHPMPVHIDGATAQFFDRLAPELPLSQRLLLANRWFFGPLLRYALGRDPSIAATCRSTMAPTLLAAGVKPNVLPVAARAVINVRVHPSDTLADVEAHAVRVIDDGRVTVRRYGDEAVEASPISPSTGDAFRALERTVRQIFPGALVAPALVPGGTDAKHYVRLSPHVYRFAPMVLSRDDLARFHGTDERLAVENYAQVVAFYYQLMKNVAGAGEESG